MEDMQTKDTQSTALTLTGTSSVAEAPSEAVKVKSTDNVLRRHIKEDPRKKLLAKNRLWMDNLQHEYPLPFHPFKIGVYIHYYNQTKYKNYLEKHIQQFTDDIHKES